MSNEPRRKPASGEAGMSKRVRSMIALALAYALGFCTPFFVPVPHDHLSTIGFFSLLLLVGKVLLSFVSVDDP